jgi:eukaryotic-like serine/threonine-protein kinase
MSFQFVILNTLPSGGNGELFIGRRTDTGEYVVPKFLREHHLVQARRAFALEVRILASNPRGFVPLLGSDADAERPFYVMPYFPRGSLTQYAGNLSDGQLHAVATELAITLAAFHARWCAHGDFKPDNVLVSQDGRPLVADPLGNGLGCAGLFSQNKGGGTPGYRAPEVRAGGPISKAGDVYSYGATLYALLTGHRPQDGQRLDLILDGYGNAPKIQEVIAACCQFDSNERPTMQEVLRVLRGEQWASIQAARKQRQQLMAVACLIAIVVLVGRFNDS